jgi:hypothetical protein
VLASKDGKDAFDDTTRRHGHRRRTSIDLCLGEPGSFAPFPTPLSAGSTTPAPVRDTDWDRIVAALRVGGRPIHAGRVVGKEYVRAMVAFLTNDSAALRAGGGLVITAFGRSVTGRSPTKP